MLTNRDELVFHLLKPINSLIGRVNKPSCVDEILEVNSLLISATVGYLT